MGSILLKDKTRKRTRQDKGQDKRTGQDNRTRQDKGQDKTKDKTKGHDRTKGQDNTHNKRLRTEFHSKREI